MTSSSTQVYIHVRTVSSDCIARKFGGLGNPFIPLKYLLYMVLIDRTCTLSIKCQIISMSILFSKKQTTCTLYSWVESQIDNPVWMMMMSLSYSPLHTVQVCIPMWMMMSSSESPNLIPQNCLLLYMNVCRHLQNTDDKPSNLNSTNTTTQGSKLESDICQFSVSTTDYKCTWVRTCTPIPII